MDKAIKWIAIGIALLVFIATAFVVAASLYDDFRIVSRDIAIVILAFFQLVVVLLVIVLLIAVLYAVKSIDQLTRQEVVPKINTTIVKIDEILDNTRAVTMNVRDSSDAATTTTTFVAEQVASPIIRAYSVVAGVRAAASSLAHRGHRRSDDGAEPQS